MRILLLTLIGLVLVLGGCAASPEPRCASRVSEPNIEPLERWWYLAEWTPDVDGECPEGFTYICEPGSPDCELRGSPDDPSGCMRSITGWGPVHCPDGYYPYCVGYSVSDGYPGLFPAECYGEKQPVCPDGAKPVCMTADEFVDWLNS